MRLLNPDQCAAWLAERTIEVDGHDARGLRYDATPWLNRFWQTPESVRNHPFFLDRLLDGLGPWKSCLAWFSGGRWPVVLDETVDDLAAWLAIHRAFGVPDGHRGAVAFDRAERGQVLALGLFEMHHGWGDLRLIPDHGLGFLTISHHEVIHATFVRPDLIEPFINRLARSGYHLPTQLPDPTFQPQPWMKPSTPSSSDLGFVSPDEGQDSSQGLISGPTPGSAP